MLSGNDALRQIDRAIDDARGEADALKRRMAELGEREVAMRTEMRGALEELARFRLDQNRAGEVAATVAGVGRDVERLMAEREAERAELARQNEAADAGIAALEKRRAETAVAIEETSQALDSAEAALQNQLEKDDAHKAQDALADKADAVAAEAEHKFQLSEEDRKTKGEPYEADTLFMYLWSRGFGTPDYRGSGLVRIGDRWVARLIRFEEARRNYHTLTEIPRRLKEHADRMRARADAEVDALVTLEKAARAKTTIPGLDETLAKARAEIETIDAEIAATREAAREQDERRAAFDRGDDPKFRAALGVMVDALDDESLAELRSAARRTRMPEDDRIVERLIAIDDDLDDVVRERGEISALAREKSARLTEMEDMRVEFRHRKYDDYGSQFSDGGLFGVILAEFLRGAISGSAYWDRLDRANRRTTRHSRPDFGSGRFRFPGPLSFPGSRGSSGGSGRSGGFRTGGGMSRGGGFRTGGGF